MLTERQCMILQAIVKDYIRSAEPVGSRTIAKQGGISFSPATIRNEMADLEEMGFLEQPHTSAGRVPSQKGYRYYVDHLIQLEKMDDSIRDDIRQLFQQKYIEIDQSIRQTAVVLSELTSYMTIILGPEIFQTQLRHLQIIPLDDQKAVAILVTDNGKVENKVVTFPNNVSFDQVEKMVNIINYRLRGVSIAQLQNRIFTELADEMQKNLQKYEDVVAILNQVFLPQRGEKVYLGGTTQILSQPEFRDVEKAKILFRLLEQTDKMAQLFHHDEKGILVKIGTENNDDAVNQCSIITASYEIDGQVVGTVGILGPTRMDYGKVIGMIETISKDLTKLLNGSFGNK